MGNRSFSKLHKVFLKLYLVKSIRKSEKWLFWNLKETTYYAQNRVNYLDRGSIFTSYLCDIGNLTYSNVLFDPLFGIISFVVKNESELQMQCKTS